MSQQYTLELRFGNAILEAGFTAVPNLFLQHYQYLRLSDSQAMWIIHLLRYKWTAGAPFPRQGNIPMACAEKTRRRHASYLRSQGLLFTRRIYHTDQTTPSPDLIGKLRTLEYHLDTLIHNITRVADHVTAHRPISDFAIELPFDTAKRAATGWYHDVPAAIKIACEQHLITTAIGQPLLLPQNGAVVTTTPKATSRKATSRKATSSVWGKHKEDSDSKEETTDSKQQEEPTTTTPTPVVAVDHNCLKILSSIGIMEPTRSQILTLHHVTADYLQSWLDWYEDQDKAGPGLVINNIRAGITAPPTKPQHRVDSRECDRQRYLTQFKERGIIPDLDRFGIKY
jgi:hypothetical protein